MTLDMLDDLERQARASESETVPGAFFGVMIKGDELLELVRTQRALELLRAHKALPHVANTMRADRHEWAYNERTGDNEDYPGEARECREAYDLALALMREEPWPSEHGGD